MILDILRARARLRHHLTPTPLRRSAWLSAALGGDVSLKLETVNPTHSFKIRGAFNAVGALAETRQPGERLRLVTASAGNHGQAMALAASTLGASLVVFTPIDAPDTKTSAIRRYGATLHGEARNYDEAERLARDYARTEGAVYVSPYNDPAVIAGAGTIGLEIAEADPSVDVVIVPLGGGGLASGVGLALRAAAPRARIVGVEVEASSPFTIGLARGVITPIEPGPTLADGLAGNLEDGSITFPLVQQVVDDVVTVGEADLVTALRGLVGEEHTIVEGSSATVVAAMTCGRVPVAGRRAVAVITGANIDVHRLNACLAPGAASG